MDAPSSKAPYAPSPPSVPSPKKESLPKFVIGCSDEDFGEEQEEENEVLHVVPPDGGWGWVVVGASFMCNAIVDGIIFTSGMLFPTMKEAFGASNAEVALISSLLGGFYLIVGPFVSALANAFGFRAVCILGSILASVSCCISYFAPNIYVLYVTFGIMGGMGFGLIYVPAVIATGFYFEKKRALATGIAVCGSGIGTFAMSPLNTFLLKTLGDRWQLIFFVYAGIVICCAFFGLAFRPLTAATGKSRKMSDEDYFEVNRTPLLIRIKRARDLELAQCPSALSMSSAYSRTNSKSTLDEQYLVNGEIKSSSVARALLDRHGGAVGGGGGLAKRFSSPGIVISAPEPILEEAEGAITDEDPDTTSMTGTQPTSGNTVPPTSKEPNHTDSNSQQKSEMDNSTEIEKEKSPLLDNNKNETSVASNTSPVVTSPVVTSPVVTSPVVTSPVANVNKDTLLPIPEGSCCPRNMSLPSLGLHPNHLALERRRPSRLALRTEISRPFNRDDIFYSGSLARLPQYQSSETMTQYHASVTNLPPLELIVEGEDSNRGCVIALRSVLAKIFDFSLLSSVTFVVLAFSGFLSLMSLFVPFNFLPSYASDVGVSPNDASFLVALIGICNTVGRIIAGWVSDHPKVDALFVNNLALILGGAATVALPFISDLSLLYCYAVVFGLSVAAFASLRSILLVELLGLEKLTNAFGLLLLFQGFAALFGSPIAGLLVDLTDSYNISFYVFGSVFAFSGIICIPLRRIKKWEDERIDNRLRREKYGVQ